MLPNEPLNDKKLNYQRFLQILNHGAADGVFEVSIEPGTRQARVGYFDSIQQAITEVSRYEGNANVYVSLNPVKRDLLARANNRLVPTKTRTADDDVLCDSWFFIDVDAIRPTGISSTENELLAALELSEVVCIFLNNAGVPNQSIVKAMSGNGAYVLVRLPNYEITQEWKQTKKALLNYLADILDTDQAKIDRIVYNPSRLVALVGTLKCKGDSTNERPHRCSEIISVGGEEFNATSDQQAEPFDLWSLFKNTLSAQPEKKNVTVAQNLSHFNILNYTNMIEGYHETARGWGYGRCPSHQGQRSTSLFIRLENGAYGCFNNCTTDQIREALGVPKLTMDLPTIQTDRACGAELKITKLSDVQAEEVSWLWFPYIAKGKMTLIEGDPGLGKSYITLAIATAIAAGRGLPHTGTTEPRNVLLLSAEDGLADTIRPRLDIMNADVGRIFAIESAVVFDDKGLQQVESAINEYNPAIVIIDPLFAYFGSGIDLHRANETRAVMSELTRIAGEHDCALLGLRHLTKSGKDRAIYRGLGSIDITAAARSVLLVGCDPDDSNNRAMVQTKNNLAPLGPAVGYEILENRFYWKLYTSLTAARILATSVDGEEGRPMLREAEEFLQATLSDGPHPAAEVQREAKAVGISDSTLKRARAALKIESYHEGQPGKKGQRWMWKLSDSPEGDQTALEGGQERTDDLLRLKKQAKPIAPEIYSKEVIPEMLDPLRVSGDSKEQYPLFASEEDHTSICEPDREIDYQLSPETIATLRHQAGIA